MRRLTILPPALTLLWVAVVAAQVPAPPAAASFEVASIRENTSGATGGGGSVRPGGRWMATNIPISLVISLSYGIPSSRILGAPDWVAAVRYDINASAGQELTEPQLAEAMRRLLRDRFRFAARIEQRELPVYNVVLARADGRLGPGLRPTVDCEDPVARAQAAAKGLATCARGIPSEGRGVLAAGGIRIQSLIVVLTAASGRPVFDRTGLTGGFDVDLRWTALGADAPPADAVSIFTAVQEQLGLRLESATAPLDVVVVDRVERPTEN